MYERALPMVMEIMGSPVTMRDPRGSAVSLLFLKDLKALMLFSPESRQVLLQTERWQELLLSFLSADSAPRDVETRYVRARCPFWLLIGC